LIIDIGLVLQSGVESLTASNEPFVSCVVPYSVKNIRNLYYNRSIDINQSNELITNWRRNDVWLVWKRTKVSDNSVDYQYNKASKRGNDVYRWRVKNRHKIICDFLEDNDNIKYILCDDNNRPYCKVLKFTLVVNTNRFSLNSWNKRECSLYVDRFTKRLRNKYSNVRIARSTEVSQNGYLHVNLICYFKDEKFQVFLYKSKKDGSLSWRLKDYSLKQEMGKLWKAGYVDTRAIESSHDLLEYSLKYHIKYFTNEKSKKNQMFTLSVLTLFGKRAISIPKSFVNDVIDYSVSVSSEEVYRRDNSVPNSLSDEYTYEFLGVMSYDEAGFDSDLWKFVDTKPPPFLFFDNDLNNALDEINCNQFSLYLSHKEYWENPELTEFDRGGRSRYFNSERILSSGYKPVCKRRVVGMKKKYEFLRSRYGRQ
jgi:hypothetical protein